MADIKSAQREEKELLLYHTPDRLASPSFGKSHSKRNVVIIGLAVFLGVAVFTLCGPHKEEVCTEPHCVITAARFLQSLNTSVDPCEDFYEYACGGWVKANPIPDDKSRVGTFDDLADKNLLILKDILEGTYKADPSLSGEEEKVDRQNFEKAQGLYLSCKNESGIEAVGAGPMIDLLRDVSKQFPLKAVNGVNGEKLSQAVANAHNLGVSALFSMSVESDDREPDVNIIRFRQAGLTLPSKEYYEEADFVDVLEKTIGTVFAKMLPNVTNEEKDWKALARDVVRFEKALANISVPNAEMNDPGKLYNRFTPKTLQALSSGIAWTSYLEHRFPADSYPNVVNDSTPLIVEVPTYFGNLSSVASGTSSDTVQNYILWYVVLIDMSPTVANSKFRKYIWNFAEYTEVVKELLNDLREKTGSRAKVEPPRWRTCVSLVDNWMGEIPAKWFIAEAFSGDSKAAASQTIDFIKNAFIKRLPNLEWLDSETLKVGEHAVQFSAFIYALGLIQTTHFKVAIEKTNNLERKIGYPDSIMHPLEMAKKYEDFSVDPDTFFENMIKAEKWSTKENLQDILKPVDRSRWGMTPPTVNAYYNPPMNEIVFPAGILQPPFYGALDPQYINYGGIGMVVGHELTHAFDQGGRQYDAHGRLRDWWSNTTAKEFEQKTKCFVDQYSKYTVKDPNGGEVHVDGTLTLGENLADNGGLSRAFEAWSADRQSPGGDKRNVMLPGFKDHTKEQLYFLSFANVWCNNIQPSAAVNRVIHKFGDTFELSQCIDSSPSP
ncbi:Peptidase M13 [Borealophlyctis nickersoniae]|nr:Peptidase M13 [Borealophlyctis nickersoniae]